MCYFHCSASVFNHAVSPCIHAVTINKHAQCLQVCSHPVMKKDKGQTQTYSLKIILLQRTISVWEIHVRGTLLTVYHPIVVDRAWEQTLFSQALLSHGVLVEHDDDDLWRWHTGSTVQPNLFCYFFCVFFTWKIIGSHYHGDKCVTARRFCLLVVMNTRKTIRGLNEELLLRSRWVIVMQLLKRTQGFVSNKLLFGVWSWAALFLTSTTLINLKGVTEVWGWR